MCAFQDLLGCWGSMATRTMGVASKLSGVKGGQAGLVDRVADFKTHSSRPPIPDRKRQKVIKKNIIKVYCMTNVEKELMRRKNQN